MAQFLTLIHSGGGSQVEAANAEAVLGPWGRREEADKAGKDFYGTIAQVEDYYRNEYFWTVVEIPDPPATDIKQAVQDLLRAHGYTELKVLTLDEARDAVKDNPDKVAFADPDMLRFFT